MNSGVFCRFAFVCTARFKIVAHVQESRSHVHLSIREGQKHTDTAKQQNNPNDDCHCGYWTEQVNNPHPVYYGLGS